MQRGDHNVILLSWRRATPARIHLPRMARFISFKLAECLNKIQEKGYDIADKLHVVGLSLGGQMAGLLGYYMEKKPRRITGLDPAYAYFTWTGEQRDILNKESGQFVDIIHTDTVTLGISEAVGHADYFFNKGYRQPGCSPYLPILNEDTCSHLRAMVYYNYIITQHPNDPVFIARKCDSWQNFEEGSCDTNDTITIEPGTDIKQKEGKYYLRTKYENNHILSLGYEGSMSKKNTKL